MTPDIINAIFEGGGAALLCLNVQRLFKDKRLAGVALAPTLWFNVWGAWNLYFYHAIGQLWSWCAGMAVFAVNTAWVALALYYRGRAAAPVNPDVFELRFETRNAGRTWLCNDLMVECSPLSDQLQDAYTAVKFGWPVGMSRERRRWLESHGYAGDLKVTE